MKIVKKGDLRILTAAKNKHIRLANDVYTPADNENPAHYPYYATEIYLGINVKDEDIKDLYVEEKIGE